MYEKTANVFGWGAQLILIFSPENEDSLFSEEFSGRLLTRENRIRKHRF